MSATKFDLKDIGKSYAARTDEFIGVGRKQRLAPASKDSLRTILLIVDMQQDFVHADGTLGVPGALDDAKRLVGWIYKNTEEITAIAASLDTHLPLQIFFPGWWKNLDSGEHPAPFTQVTLADIRKGVWAALVDPKWSISYVEELEKTAKKNLMIWPYHCILGTTGHTLVPALSEAISFHSGARASQPMFLTKGTIPQVEHYGIFAPEVPYPNHPQGSMNTAYLDMLSRYDRIFVAGEAKSHCVFETMRQLLGYFASQPDVIAKIRFLVDCTSSVAHPTIDFETLTNAELSKMEKQGVRMVASKDPLK